MAQFRNEHEREAVRLRSLIAVAPTSVLKARFTQQAEEHERLASELERLKAFQREPRAACIHYL
jgi:hypothetical protein